MAARASQPTTKLDELLAGTPYRAVRFLGRGGMSEVHLVQHEYLGRSFALKLLHRRFASDTQAVDRMRIEAQATARLHHPNIVEVVDFWIGSHGQPCMVMEYLEGGTVAQRLAERKRFSVDEAVGYACQLLSALSAAHALGVVHRDVKPENLFLHEFPGHEPVLKVLDFGLARVLAQPSGAAPKPLFLPTTTGAIVGSPRFVSPEGALGERVDHRADIYSSGLVLYVMLTGHGPFDHVLASAEQLQSAEPPSRHVGNAISSELDQVVLRAIEAKPERRYQSADDFAAELALAGRLRKTRS